MKIRYFILFLFFISWQDLWGQCLYSADYYTYNNFCDLDSLYLTAHPLNGTGPYTYMWATGDTTQTISIPLALGDYLVTITDSEGCSIVINCHVKPNPLVLFYPFNQNACFGDTVTLFLDWFRDSIPGATYLWSTGETTSSILITDDITWSATVTDPNTGCEYVIPPSFFDFHPTPYPEIVGPDVICSGQTITLTVIGGPFGEIVWYPGGFYEDTIEVVWPGTYTVYGSSPEANYCWHSDSIVITEAEINPPILSGPPELCDGQSGTISVENSNEYISFLWNNNQSTSSITVTQSGTYTVTVTNDGGCTAIGEFTIEPGPGPSLNITSSPSSCGENNGSINLTPSPSGNYTFEWSNGASTEDLVNIPGGTYEVTVTAANGCTSIASTTVPDNPIVITLTATITPNTSCQVYNGGIDLSVSPAGTYTYQWSNGFTTQDLINLQAGTYTITVTTGVTCTSTADYIVTDQSSSPAYSSAISAATCGEANGSIDLSMNGGTPPFTFSWSNGSDQEDLLNVSAGSYAVTITGADGCVTTDNYSIPDSIIPIVITGQISPNTSCTGENGMIDITITPTALYTFQWSTGETTEDISNLGEGSYTVLVSLGNTCQASADFLLENNFTMPGITGIALPNSSCSQPNGSVDITVDPDGSYTYLWSNGETTEDIEEVTGGIYNVTVTSSDGCTGIAVFVIENTGSSYTITNTLTPNTSCTAPNGGIDLTVTPSGSYTFSWSDGATTEDIFGLFAGNYGVTVTDINNCSTVAVFSIDNQLSYPTLVAEIIPATCGGANGAINLNVIPQNGNSFVWSDGSTNEDLTGIGSGDYSVTVTGANGCITSDTFTVINQNSSFTLTGIPSSNNSCLNPNGSIDLVVTPSASYSFEWSNGAATEDLQNLTAGVYSVTVTDTLSCMVSDTFMVMDSTMIPILSHIITPAICGANNGGIDLTINPPGNYSILWSNGEITEDLVSAVPGTYSVIVTDINGCQGLDTFSVTNSNSNFSISASPSPNTSCNVPNGAIDVSISPAGTYTFAWSNGAISEDIFNISAGSYTVSVTDSTSCSSIETFIVGEAVPLITIDASVNPSLCGNDNGSIDVTISPPTGYVYLWSNGDFNEDLQNLPSGDYSLTVTNPDGCTGIDTFTVPAIGGVFTLDANTMDNTSCSAPNGSIDLSISPSGIYTYEWSNGSFSQDLSNLIKGIYTVTVTDENGCSSSASYSLADLAIQPLITEIIIPSTCGVGNGQIDITVNPSGTYSFNWSNGSTNEDLINIVSGTYSVTVTGLNGCSANDTLIVPNLNSNFSFTAIATANSNCTQSNGAINLTVTPSGLYTYLWSNGAISEDLDNLQAGSYTVTVSDGSGCSSADTYVVMDSLDDLEVKGTITPVLCGDPNGSIDLDVTPSSGNSFIWSDGSTSEDMDNLFPGIYSVTITAQSGCASTLSFTVEGSEKLEITLQVDVIQSGSDLINIRAEVNLPESALDTVLWLPEELFTCNQPICLEQTINRPTSQTDIIVMAVDTNGCMGQARLSLEDVIEPEVYIPNVFSPNTDGINDLFTVYGNKDVALVEELQIFDRWGNQVFTKKEFPPNEERFGWDGTFRHEVMNPAVFVYWARVRYADGSTGSFKGDITLVR